MRLLDALYGPRRPHTPSDNVSPRVHEYITRGWGHDFIWRPEPGGRRGRAAGWGHGLRKGDYFAMAGEGGNLPLYKIVRIRYEQDPADMWSATLEWVPNRNAVLRDIPGSYQKIYDAAVRVGIINEAG